jgi:hypothetical protein
MKKQITLKKSDIRTLVLILILPFVLTFLLEHLGKFDGNSLGGTTHRVHPYYGEVAYDNMVNARLHDRIFTTLLGTEIRDNLYAKDLFIYRRLDDGSITPDPYYSTKIGYYIRGIKEDIVLPLVLMVLWFLVFGLSKVFSLKIEKANDAP